MKTILYATCILIGVSGAVNVILLIEFFRKKVPQIQQPFMVSSGTWVINKKEGTAFLLGNNGEIIDTCHCNSKKFYQQ